MDEFSLSSKISNHFQTANMLMNEKISAIDLKTLYGYTKFYKKTPNLYGNNLLYDSILKKMMWHRFFIK